MFVAVHVLQQVMRVAEGAAYNRIEAARAARRFPEVLVALEDGALTPPPCDSSRLISHPTIIES